MWWILLLALLVGALVAGSVIRRRRRPRDVDGQAHPQQGARGGSASGFSGPRNFGGGQGF
jgi:hypothetical protein